MVSLTAWKKTPIQTGARVPEIVKRLAPIAISGFTFHGYVIFLKRYRMKTILNEYYVRPSLLAVVSLLLAYSASAATFSLNPSSDAFVTTGTGGSLSGNNYGGAGALSVSAANLSQNEFQSVLQFGLAGAKSSFDTQFGAGQWTIQSVTLQLTAAPPNNPIFNASSAGQFSLSWMQNDSWTEGSGTSASLSTTGITFSTLSNFVGIADEG